MNIIQCMDDRELFAPWFSGSSWLAWRAVLKGAYCLELSRDEHAVFTELTQRPPPRQPIRELWIIAGRRSGKDSIASLIAAHTASFFEGGGRLRRGERASVLCMASDKETAQIILGYVRSYFSDCQYLAAQVVRDIAGGIRLSNGVDIQIVTNDYRSVRGRAVALAILDECAFWKDDRSVSPDTEVYSAIKPGTMTVGGLIVGISTPHKKSGLLYEKWKQHYGKEGDVLVVHAPSMALNPTLDAREIANEIETDPQAGRAEWLAQWRSDLSNFLDRELIEQSVDGGVLVRHAIPNVQYYGFCDPSGGSSDSMTLAVAHSDKAGELIVLDCLAEAKAPFNAQQIVREFSTTLREYGLHSCVGDRYAAGWVQQSFAAQGVRYQHSAQDRSEIYSNCIPLFTSGKARLLDHKKLISQLAQLERRTTAGRDKIDHPAHGHDDLSNSACGAMTLAADKRNRQILGGDIVGGGKRLCYGDIGSNGYAVGGSERNPALGLPVQ